MRNKVCVIGGGISGLSAAYFLLKKGYNVDLYESSDRLGGLAASFDFDGITIEKYYHFICGGDKKLIDFANEIGINDKLKFQHTKTTSYYRGEYYPLSTPIDLLRFSPISFLSRLRFGVHTTFSKIQTKWEHLDKISAKEWLIRFIGDDAYQAIWNPLLKEKFGEYYDQISAAWIWHRIHRVASSRKNIFSKEKMGYFEGGSYTLVKTLSNKIQEMGGSIHLNQKAENIKKSNSGLTVFFRKNKHRDFEIAILAVPLPIATNIIRNIDSEFSTKLYSIKFFGVICGIFRLRKKISDAFWLNINDPRIEANGLIEYTNLNPLEEISPHKIVYIPLYVHVDNEWFLMDEASLRYRFLAMLKILKPSLGKNSVVDFRVSKSPHAQAICTIGFKDKVPPVTIPTKNLFLLDSTQIYPSDRTLSALIGLAEKMVADNFN